MKTTKPAELVVKKTISLPQKTHAKAEKNRKASMRNFSNYIAALIEADRPNSETKSAR